MSRTIRPRLRGWTVYYDPVDYPGQYVTRAWTIASGSFNPIPSPNPCYVGPDLAGARAAVPPGSYCLGRDEDDPSAVVESWV